MSWRSLSATNDTHRNSKLSAKKVIVKNIVISQETTMGSMDVSNLEYTRDDYSGNILTIEETLRGPDISLNRIKVLNQSDTSGVVKFVKPFVAPSAGLEGLRAYDGSFTTTNVLRDFQVGSVTKRDGDIIEILNDASFSNHITAPDVCANVIGSRNPTNGLPIYLSADVSINEGLQCSDISVSHIHPLDAATKLLVNDDISASGAIYASDLSGFTFRAVDVSVNDMYGANGHIDVVADISVNGVIQVTEISMNMLGGHNNRITIHNDLSVNGDLIVGEDLTLSNLFTTSDYIHFHNVTDISNDIKNLDISVGEIFPKELGNERFVKRESIEKETLIINGDVSFSGRVEADWVESEFNVLDRVPSLDILISNSAKYPIGALIQVKRANSNQIDIFIKANKESWYKLKSTNATPLFTIFTLSYEGSALSGDIANTNNDKGNYFYYPTSLEYPDVSVGLQKYEEIGGFGDYDEVVFYVKKIKDEENNVYFFDISGTDSENDDITFSLLGDKTFSDFNYLNGAGWGLSSVNSVENDISRIRIEVPINNGFDVSFVLKADDKLSTFNDKIITIKKINEVPVWKHMVLEASNYDYIRSQNYEIPSDASFNTEEWYSMHDTTYLNYDINSPILPIDYSKNVHTVSHTFNVRYYDPYKFNGDTSYYILDLSSPDPEGYDVCYEIQTANNDYLTNDWSWNLDGSKVYIKVPGENEYGNDFSFEIISHDNILDDDSGFIPTDYYSFDGKNISKRIVNFHKEIILPQLSKSNIIIEYNHSIDDINSYNNIDFQTDNLLNVLDLRYQEILDITSSDINIPILYYPDIDITVFVRVIVFTPQSEIIYDISNDNNSADLKNSTPRVNTEVISFDISLIQSISMPEKTIFLKSNILTQSEILATLRFTYYSYIKMTGVKYNDAVFNNGQFSGNNMSDIIEFSGTQTQTHKYSFVFDNIWAPSDYFSPSTAYQSIGSGTNGSGANGRINYQISLPNTNSPLPRNVNNFTSLITSIKLEIKTGLELNQRVIANSSSNITFNNILTTTIDMPIIAAITQSYVESWVGDKTEDDGQTKSFGVKTLYGESVYIELQNDNININGVLYETTGRVGDRNNVSITIIGNGGKGGNGGYGSACDDRYDNHYHVASGGGGGGGGIGTYNTVTYNNVQHIHSNGTTIDVTTDAGNTTINAPDSPNPGGNAGAYTAWQNTGQYTPKTAGTGGDATYDGVAAGAQSGGNGIHERWYFASSTQTRAGGGGGRGADAGTGDTVLPDGRTVSVDLPGGGKGGDGADQQPNTSGTSTTGGDPGSPGSHPIYLAYIYITCYNA